MAVQCILDGIATSCNRGLVKSSDGTSVTEDIETGMDVSRAVAEAAEGLATPFDLVFVPCCNNATRIGKS